MTGTRTGRARQLTAVVVLSLLFAALPGVAWADHGDRGRGGDGRDRWAQSDRRTDHGRDEHDGKDRRGKDRWAPSDRHEERRHDDRDRRSRQDARAPRDDSLVTAASALTDRDDVRDAERQVIQRGKDELEQARRKPAREPDNARQRHQARKQAERAEREQAERERAERERAERAQAERRRARERAEREGQETSRNRLELDRVVWSASAEARREREQLDRDLRRWLEEAEADTVREPTIAPDEPRQEETEVVTAPPATPPAPPADAPAEPTYDTPVAEPQPASAAPTTLAADALAHERGMVGRTFDIGSELLRDTGRAVVASIPPRARSFSIPLGLLVAIGGYLVLQRRFRPGTLPMSAASVPEQEGARERHRL